MRKSMTSSALNGRYSIRKRTGNKSWRNLEKILEKNRMFPTKDLMIKYVQTLQNLQVLQNHLILTYPYVRIFVKIQKYQEDLKPFDAIKNPEVPVFLTGILLQYFQYQTRRKGRTYLLRADSTLAGCFREPMKGLDTRPKRDSCESYDMPKPRRKSSRQPEI
jgi:hypothetical protein